MTVSKYKTTILVITMLSILSLAAPVMAGGELNVTRVISDQTVAPGSTFTVTLTVTANTEVIAPAVNEDIPVGAVTVIEDADMMYKASTDEYIFLGKMSAGESKTVTYEVTVPDDADLQEYNITGTASGYDVDPVCIGGDGEMTLLLKTADIDGSGGKPTLNDAMHLAKYVVGLSGYETIHAYGDIDGSGGKPTLNDAMHLAKYVVGLSGYETIY